LVRVEDPLGGHATGKTHLCGLAGNGPGKSMKMTLQQLQNVECFQRIRKFKKLGKRPLYLSRFSGGRALSPLKTELSIANSPG